MEKLTWSEKVYLFIIFGIISRLGRISSFDLTRHRIQGILRKSVNL